MSDPFSYPWINGGSMADQQFATPFQFIDAPNISITYLQLTDIAKAGPASKASIQSLKIVKSREDEKLEEECTICLEKLFDKENKEKSCIRHCKEVVVKETPCGHRYHGDCIEQWLEIHGSCPLCRYQMPQEDREEEVREIDMSWKLKLSCFDSS